MGEHGRVAVISDVHGNARAYAAALALARKRGFDELILLGDLLTYGCEPTAVLKLTHDAINRDGAVLVRGNHDQLYADLARGDRTYYSTLPGWLREAVDWTAAFIGDSDLETMFPWVDRYEHDHFLFAHANPFAYGDWTYLTGAVNLASAARELSKQSTQVGVFGHTHRHRVIEVSPDGRCRVATPAADRASSIALRPDMDQGRTAIIVDPGSVGQPRDQCKLSTILFLTYTGRVLQLEFVRVLYDAEAHRRAIIHASLSGATRAKLLRYLP